MIDKSLISQYPIEAKPCHVVIGIDPGNNTGIAIYHIDNKDPYTIYSIRFLTHYTNQLFEFETLDKKVKLMKRSHTPSLYKDFCVLFRHFQPSLVITEDIFVNKKFPQASISLAKCMKDIELAVSEMQNEYLKFMKVPPLVVKQFIAQSTGKQKLSSDSIKTKDSIKEELLSINEVYQNLKNIPQTDHEIDALAIGYFGVDIIRQTPNFIYL